MASLAKIGVQIIPLDASDAAALTRVRNSNRARMPDAVALDAALKHGGVGTGVGLATFDEALTAAAGKAGVRATR